MKARCANADGRLRPGLFARVDLGVAVRSGVLMVPEEAVLQRADGAVVFRRGAGNRVERRVIKAGVHRGGMVEIVKGSPRATRRGCAARPGSSTARSVSPRNSDGSAAGADQRRRRGREPPARPTP